MPGKNFASRGFEHGPSEYVTTDSSIHWTTSVSADVAINWVFKKSYAFLLCGDWQFSSFFKDDFSGFRVELNL